MKNKTKVHASPTSSQKSETCIVPMSNDESRVSSASSMNSEVIEKPHEKENSFTETELIYPPITSLHTPVITAADVYVADK